MDVLFPLACLHHVRFLNNPPPPSTHTHTHPSTKKCLNFSHTHTHTYMCNLKLLLTAFSSGSGFPPKQELMWLILTPWLASTASGTALILPVAFRNHVFAVFTVIYVCMWALYCLQTMHDAFHFILKGWEHKIFKRNLFLFPFLEDSSDWIGGPFVPTCSALFQNCPVPRNKNMLLPKIIHSPNRDSCSRRYWWIASCWGWAGVSLGGLRPGPSDQHSCLRGCNANTGWIWSRAESASSFCIRIVGGFQQPLNVQRRVAS